MLHITSFDYVLMIIILLVVFIKQIQSMCCVVKEKFCLVLGSIMLRLVIAGALGEFDSVSKDCIVKNTDFFKTFKNFQKKFHETFTDTSNFTNNMKNYKEEFAEVLTHILVSEHDISNLNLLGFTECQTNVRLFKYFLGTLFQSTGTMNDTELNKEKLVSTEKIKKFLTNIYNNLPIKMEFPEELENANNMDETTLRTMFKEIVLYDPSIGLTSIILEFHGLLDEYVKIREDIEQLKFSGDNDALKIREDDKKQFAKRVQITYDNNTKIFKMWDDGKSSYKNKNNMKTNIKRPYFEKIFEISKDTILDEMIEFEEGCKKNPEDIWKIPMYSNRNGASETQDSQGSQDSTLDIRKLYDS